MRSKPVCTNTALKSWPSARAITQSWMFQITSWPNHPNITQMQATVCGHVATLKVFSHTASLIFFVQIAWFCSAPYIVVFISQQALSTGKGQRIQLSALLDANKHVSPTGTTAGAVWGCLFYIRCKWSSRRRQRRISSQCDILLFVDLCTCSLLHRCRRLPQSPPSESNTRVVFGFVEFFCFLQDSLPPKVHRGSHQMSVLWWFSCLFIAGPLVCHLV